MPIKIKIVAKINIIEDAILFKITLGDNFDSGNIGWSIICINGVSFLNVTLASSILPNNWVKIVVFAWTSTCFCFVGELFKFKDGFKL